MPKWAELGDLILAGETGDRHHVYLLMFGKLGACPRVPPCFPVFPCFLAPMLVRHVRAAFIEVLRAPFIQAARGLGIPRGRVLFRHALPAAANPLISLFGVSLGTLLSGSLLIEVVMSWPGVGPLLLEAILERDMYVVVAAVMLSTVFLVAGNLLADVLLHLTDPRVRLP